MIEILNYGSCCWIKLDGEYLIGNVTSAGNCTNSSGRVFQLKLLQVKGPKNGSTETSAGAPAKKTLNLEFFVPFIHTTLVLQQLQGYGSSGGASGGLKVNGRSSCFWIPDLYG